MRALGMATRVKDKTAIISVVLLEHPSPAQLDVAAVSIVEKFEIKVDEAPQAQQLGELANRVDGHIRSMAPDRIVVRRADVPKTPAKTEGPRFRLLLEGSVTAAAQRIVPDTHIRNGRGCAAAYQSTTTKDELDDVARDLIGENKYAEAAAAALSAFDA